MPDFPENASLKVAQDLDVLAVWQLLTNLSLDLTRLALLPEQRAEPHIDAEPNVGGIWLLANFAPSITGPRNSDAKGVCSVNRLSPLFEFHTILQEVFIPVNGSLFFFKNSFLGSDLQRMAGACGSCPKCGFH